MRFTRSGESQRITTSMIGAIGDLDAPEPRRNRPPIRRPAPQNFETTVSPQPRKPQGSFETTISPSTGDNQLNQSGEVATEFIARVEITPEPSKPAPDAAKPGAPPPSPSAQATPGTEYLPRSEDARAAPITPVEPAKGQEVGKKPSPNDKPEKKEKKEKKEKRRKRRRPTPRLRSKSQRRRRGLTSKKPLLIGVGAALAVVLAATVWMVISWGNEGGSRGDATPTPLPTVTPIDVPPGMAYVPGESFAPGAMTA